MKTKQVPIAKTARKKRAAMELAGGMRLWLNLGDSLRQSRASGITLAEAKNRLAERLAAEVPSRPRKPARAGSRRPRQEPRAGRRTVGQS